MFNCCPCQSISLAPIPQQQWMYSLGEVKLKLIQIMFCKNVCKKINIIYLFKGSTVYNLLHIQVKRESRHTPINVWGLGKSVQFEVHAIKLCSRENLSRKLISEIIYIISDGQTTFKTLHACIYQCLSLSGIFCFVWKNVMTDSGN